MIDIGLGLAYHHSSNFQRPS